MTAFAAIRRHEGYLPIEDHGLIGDGVTVALVGRDGGISWLCVPRFDSTPLFCGLLDSQRGGSLSLAPEEVLSARQAYLPGTAVLVTEMEAPSGLVRVTDALLLRSGADLREDDVAARGELTRTAEVTGGPVTLRLGLEPFRGGTFRRTGAGVLLHAPDRPDVLIDVDREIAWSEPEEGRSLSSRLDLAPGDRLTLSVRWGSALHRSSPADRPAGADATAAVWRRWSEQIEYEGPQQALVRRSAITLKLLDHFENGAIVAAATSSLPEAIGGVRNWDYRYTWVRDAAFSVYALRRIGLHAEAWRFLAWTLDAVERHGEPRIMYDVSSAESPREVSDPVLSGYRGSAPVRWGNDAAQQHQNDVYGELVDCAYQWATRGGRIDRLLWPRLRRLIEEASRRWSEPDHGIWEVRTPGRVFTYSAALCHVALDRGAQIAGLVGDRSLAGAWARRAAEVREAVLTRAWDATADSFTEHLGGGGLDASLLAMPLRRVVRADDPRMVATAKRIEERLGAGNGLLYRYLPDISPDGLPGHEGAFLLCSFWLADNLALQGRLDEAHRLYEALCARANPLGLLPEQIDPETGQFLGNFPQAFSHVGVIATGTTLAQLGH